MRIEAVAYDHPDAARLIGEVQQEYVIRYGGVDDSPVDPAEFTPPSGLFLVGYDGDAAVVCGGWRACGPGDTDAEIRRMYVVPAARGRGLARRMLAELERTARDAGHQRMILETGRPQPEAVALYRSSRYTEIPAYGYYAGSPHSMHFGKVLGAPDMGNARDLAAMSSPRHRALRSDAVANRDRLLAAATAAVKRDGEKAPMATVAAGAGVGVGTLYRHFPTREALLAALVTQSYEIVLSAARRAAMRPEPALTSLRAFLDEVIRRRDELILPLHGGPVTLDPGTVALRDSISQAIDQVLARGRAEGAVGPQITSGDIIIMGALLAQPLPHVPDWEQTARRAARIYLAGLAPASAQELPGAGLTRADLEAQLAGPGPAGRPARPGPAGRPARPGPAGPAR
ncbi:MAG: GNAT family N-acetyltransferase [Streptosporangiaceae bacterium]